MIAYLPLIGFLLFGFIAWFVGMIQKQKRLNRLYHASLEEKLLASMLKNPDDGPFYF